MNKYTINRWADHIVILGPGDERLTLPHVDLGRMIEVLGRIDGEIALFPREGDER